jgi:hypothetical protein
MKIHILVFHVLVLKPFHESTILGRHIWQPPLVEIDGEEEFDIEKILDSWIFHGRLKYLVH